jgi:predicted HNH restriction endonuclease
VVGLCGWLVLERSHQQQYLDNARTFDSQNINPQKITKSETLTEARNQLQTIISQLEEIPDRPASLYADAQSELTTLRPKLEQFDRKINIEQVANKNLDLSKNITIEAVKLTQNPPHKSTVWKAAQDKRKQALKVLEEISPDSLLYPDAQARIKSSRAELVQIGKWVEIQQRAELSANNLTANTINQLKQLKAKTPDKQKFLPQCKTTLQTQISNAEAQRAGLPAVTLAEYLCAYFSDS